MGVASVLYDDVSDEDLAELARRGSGAAFSLLVARYRQPVWVIARNMFASPTDAADVTRQTFLCLHRQMASRRTVAPFRLSLYATAVKTAMARRLRDQRRPPCSLDSFLPRFDREGRVVLRSGPWLDDGPFGDIAVTVALREALEFIDDDIRAAFVLRDVLELSVDDASKVLETSSAEVRKHTHRARLILRGLFDQMG
jgi:RNA polymerase sigma-70 factor (ECF subfamily)